MAESSLSVTYADLSRELLRYQSGGETYSRGTLTVSSGVATLAGGTVASWAADGVVNIGGTVYTVDSRDSDSQFTLDDTSVNESAGTAYVLFQADEYQQQQVEDALRAGLRQFYFPPPVGENPHPHQWSFLSPTDTLSLTTGTHTYDLPDDCGQDTKDWTYGVGDDELRLVEVKDNHLRSMQAKDNASGTPKYVAVRPKSHTATTGQRFEAVFYPTPNASETVSYRYNVVPDALDPENKYPLGGGVHADTIRASCLAAAERNTDEAETVHNSEFQRRLAASVQIDRRAESVEGDSYPNTAVTYGTYEWLQQEIGAALEIGANFKTWSHAETQRVDSLIHRGVEQFYMPPLTGAAHQRAHRWSFLRPLTTIDTVASFSDGTVEIVDGVVTLTDGTWPSWAADGELVIDGVTYTVDSRDSDTQLTLDDTTVDADAGETFVLQQTLYDLPSDFGGIDGPLTYRPGTSTFYPPIRIVDEARIRRKLMVWETSERPREAALILKAPDASTGTRWQIKFWPPPDSAYELTYRYKAKQDSIAAGEYPLGGREHAGTILASCLAVAGVKGAQDQFDRLLMASIEIDQAEFAPESLGFNRDRSDGPGLSRDDEYGSCTDTPFVRFNGVLWD